MKPVNKDCILVDIRSFDVLCNDAISFKDALVKNDEARSVGEFFLVWIPLQLNLLIAALDVVRAAIPADAVGGNKLFSGFLITPKTIIH